MAQWKRICLPMQEAQETWVLFLGREDPLEEEMATHSSIFAWEIPWTEEPGGLQSMGAQRVGHNLATKQQQIYLPWDSQSWFSELLLIHANALEAVRSRVLWHGNHQEWIVFYNWPWKAWRNPLTILNPVFYHIKWKSREASTHLNEKSSEDSAF